MQTAAAAALALIAALSFQTSPLRAQTQPSQIPDPALTPGAAVSGLRWEQLCPTIALPQRSISTATREKVFKQYGVKDCVVKGSTPDNPLPTCGALYELDHLIPHALGGADAVENLWPQRLTGPCNAVHKDKLERFAHSAYCSGQLTLDEARALFTGDWRREYQKRFGAC